jgi:dipeptidyl aminopeptidase/acylaminoacyl peptidase
MMLHFGAAAIVGAGLLAGASRPSAQERRPLQLDDWYAIRNVGGPAVSPTDGSSPRFSPDGRFLAFVSDRYVAGGPVTQKVVDKGQVFLLPLAGGEAYPVTSLKEGVDSFRWAPDSRGLVVVSRDSRADEDDKGTKDDEGETPPPIVLTRLQDKRDGSGWLDLRRRHLYLVSLDAAIGKPGGAIGETKPLTSDPGSEDTCLVTGRTADRLRSPTREPADLRDPAGERHRRGRRRATGRRGQAGSPRERRAAVVG